MPCEALRKSCAILDLAQSDSSATLRLRASAVTDMAVLSGLSLVTWEMIPPEWFLSPEALSEWMAWAAAHAPDDPALPIVRRICVELPDCSLAWEYHDAYLAATQHRTDLVPCLISSLEQWNDRPTQLAAVMGRLIQGLPPTTVICAIAGRESAQH